MREGEGVSGAVALLKKLIADVEKEASNPCARKLSTVATHHTVDQACPGDIPACSVTEARVRHRS